MTSAMAEINKRVDAKEAAEEKRAAFKSLIELGRPAAIHKPSIFIDGNRWCALYGPNLQEGVAGFGETPLEACRAFDREWRNAKPPKYKEAA